MLLHTLLSHVLPRQDRKCGTGDMSVIWINKELIQALVKFLFDSKSLATPATTTDNQIPLQRDCSEGQLSVMLNHCSTNSAERSLLFHCKSCFAIPAFFSTRKQWKYSNSIKKKKTNSKTLQTMLTIPKPNIHNAETQWTTLLVYQWHV